MSAPTIGRTVNEFLNRVTTSDDPQALQVLDLTKRELDLIMAALNTLPDDSLAIDNLNQTARKCKVSPQYIATLKSKKVFERGKDKGQWNFTERFHKKLVAFLALAPLTPEEAVEAAEAMPKVRGKGSMAERADAKLIDPDLSSMNFGKLEDHINRINDRILFHQNQIADLESTKVKIKEGLRKKLGL